MNDVVPPRNIILNGEAEIVFVNKSMKVAKVFVFLDTTPEQFNQSDELKQIFQHKMYCAIDYMVKEGYIPSYKEDSQWMVESEARQKKTTNI